ncbi:hypothetical protein [Duganella sp. BuS-21]|uniref:hypothetical protein n=1 Tax=Duganella sp. BuS-21 TaxID=2943848 RepID=UPI0035A5CCC8
MQAYVLKLAVNETRPFNLVGDLFVYESATPTPSTGETRIRVKPDSGAEMVLRPGQRFRLSPGEKAQHWEVKAYDPAVQLDGAVIIGAGEFDDANTLNKVQLDATFANIVKVNNTTAERVPVQLDPSTTINVAGTTVQYTNAFANNSVAATAAIQVFTAAQNPNGAYIEFAEVSLAGSNSGATSPASVSLLAGAVAPTTDIDGDLIFVVSMGSMVGSSSMAQAASVNEKLSVRVKIAAGKGLWVNQTAVTGICKKTVLYTLL